MATETEIVSAIPWSPFPTARRVIPGVLDDDLGISVLCGHGKALFLQQFDMFLHSPFGLVQAILDGMPDAGKAFQVGGVEAEVVRLFRGFDH